MVQRKDTVEAVYVPFSPIPPLEVQLENSHSIQTGGFPIEGYCHFTSAFSIRHGKKGIREIRAAFFISAQCPPYCRQVLKAKFGRLRKRFKRGNDLLPGTAVRSLKNPHELAKHDAVDPARVLNAQLVPKKHSHSMCLRRIVLYEVAHEQIGIDTDQPPAPSRIAASISSSVTGFEGATP
jgi:hypothetical protein